MPHSPDLLHEKLEAAWKRRRALSRMTLHELQTLQFDLAAMMGHLGRGHSQVHHHENGTWYVDQRCARAIALYRLFREEVRKPPALPEDDDEYLLYDIGFDLDLDTTLGSYVERGVHLHQCLVGVGSMIHEKTTIGRLTDIGDGTYIGRECAIGAQVLFANPGTESYHLRTRVGNNVTIGDRVLLCPGTIIGDHSVVEDGVAITPGTHVIQKDGKITELGNEIEPFSRVRLTETPHVVRIER